MKRLQYEEIKYLTTEEVEAALERNNKGDLLYVPISVSLYSTDLDWAQAICVKLSSHEHFNVRGNAVLGFSHLSRRFGKLDRNLVKPVVEAAMHDPHEYVRMQANDAADDLRHFLKWRFSKRS